MTDETFFDQLEASAKIGKLREALEIIPQVRANRLRALEMVDELERALAMEWAKMTGVKMVSFSERDLRQFKVVYARAVKNGLTQFEYGGNEYLVSYAKYLIEYLEGQFK